MLPGLAGMCASGSILEQYVDIRDNIVIEESTGPATAFYSLLSSGDIQDSDGAGGTWLLLRSASNYRARATLISKSLAAAPSGTFDSWLSLSSDRTWSLTADGNVVGNGTRLNAKFLVEVRDSVAPYTVFDSATIDLIAEDM